MRLSADPIKLSRMAADELREAIVERRAAIRAHRDAKGDDRCWIDDHTVWPLVEGAPGDLQDVPPAEEGMRRCREFYQHRRADAPDPAAADGVAGDGDLDAMAQPQLVKCLATLQSAIRAHALIKGRPRTLDDDRALYAVLPEKTAADFRLPPEDEFLGERKAPHAGCPAFWRSHGSCPAQKHDLHRWGPCRKETA